MSQERRRFERAPESFPAKCRLTGSGETWREIQTINISAGGIRFLSPLPFEQQDSVDLRMTLPATNEELLITGIVVWIKSPAASLIEVGIEFQKLTTDEEMKIDEVVDFLMKQPRSSSSTDAGPTTPPPAS